MAKGDAKQEVIDAGRWLASERGKRGNVSNRQIATFATVLAKRQGFPVTIHQQQLSAIENSDADSGPAKLPAWWAIVRELIESGQLDQAIAASAPPAKPSPAADRELFITDADGRKIGRITLFSEFL